MPDQPDPPIAAKQPTRTTIHGVTLTDDYAWLRDANWREAMQNPSQLDADIRAHLEAENTHAEAMMANTVDLQKSLVAEMRARIAEADASVPTPDGDHVYYVRFREGGQHPIFCRAPRSSDDTAEPGEPLAGEQILLDGDAEAEGREYFSLGGVEHSPGHAKLAYAVDDSGAETYTIRVREIGTGDERQPPIGNATGNVVWSADSSVLFFTTLDDNHRPCRVWRIALGAEPADAELVYEEADPGFFVGLEETQSAAYILIHAHDHATSEIRFIPADTPGATPRLIAERVPGREYNVDDDNGADFVILTNAGEAEDFRLMRAPIEQPGYAHWEEIVPHVPGRLILDHVEFAHHRVRMERAEALPRLVITDKTNGTDHAIAFDDEAYSLGMAGGYEYDTSTLRFLYSAPHTPDQTFDYDMATRERRLRKQRRVPSGFDPAHYRVRRVTAEARDGEHVPITITHHRDTPLDGSAPCLLHGYGAYGISEPAAFSSTRFSLIDRGFIHAIAHVRGGKERGFRWYKQGKLENKPNTFADFIRVAEHLTETGYTSAGRIAAFGGSAGGMLVGAVVNQRPALFGAAIADVPFVDVLNTMMDDSLPLTPPEWPEWGNPRDDARAFETIRSYCPYQNVAAQDYPAMLVIAGVSDPRVTYWEPAKWVAKLRATKTDNNTLLLKTHMAAGHGGVSGRFAALEETGLIFAFLLKTLAPQAAGLAA